MNTYVRKIPIYLFIYRTSVTYRTLIHTYPHMFVDVRMRVRMHACEGVADVP